MDRIIHCIVRLSCSPDEAFEMFTVNARIQAWLAEQADVEPRVGGKYELFWDPEHRERNSTLGCRITAIETGKLLCFEWKGPVQFASFMNTADPLTHVTVLFLPNREQEGAAEVHLIHTGWRSDEYWEQARTWFEPVWRNALENLRRLVNEQELAA